MFTGLASPTHLLILLVIILLLFGAKRLPEMGRSLGQGIQEFKDKLNAKDETEQRGTEAVEEELTKPDPGPGVRLQNKEASDTRDVHSSSWS
jgi:sec-independent protein translocase protein TatA